MVLLSMIFCHILDDFILQGWMANGKQKKWWEENAPQELYRYDYLWVLLMHSFSWSFMMMLPTILVSWFNVSPWFYIVFAFNIIIHFIVDNMKANKRNINLIQDQCIHMVQIVITYLLYLVSNIIY